MTEYIDRAEFLKRIEPYNTPDKTDKALYNFALNKMMEAPNADVVERERIDKVIKEINDAKVEVDFMNDYADGFNSGLFKTLEILKKNIGE